MKFFFFRIPRIAYTVAIISSEGNTRFKSSNDMFRFKVATTLWHPGVPRREKKNLRNAGNLHFETRDSIRALDSVI